MHGFRMGNRRRKEQRSAVVNQFQGDCQTGEPQPPILAFSAHEHEIWARSQWQPPLTPPQCADPVAAASMYTRSHQQAAARQANAARQLLAEHISYALKRVGMRVEVFFWGSQAATRSAISKSLADRKVLKRIGMRVDPSGHRLSLPRTTVLADHEAAFLQWLCELITSRRSCATAQRMSS
jgi:hypothetical protein